MWRIYIFWVFSVFCNFESVVALDNGLARFPPMGWMSWAFTRNNLDCDNRPVNCINEKLYMDMADKLVSDGYRELGYRSVHIDDAWMEMQRDADGRLVADQKRFPSGIKALSKYMHDRDLKMGLYSSIGNATCMHYPGLLNYHDNDAKSFAEWDIDHLKVDDCFINGTNQIYHLHDLYEEFNTFGVSLAREGNLTGRPIVYACSPFGNYSLIRSVCNVWRNHDDVNEWKDIVSTIEYYGQHQDELIAANGPGGWNDPDMIIVGHSALNANHGMERVQMSIWSIWSAPLLMSNDLRIINADSRAILQNRKVIAIDQDPLGQMGRCVFMNDSINVYVKNVSPVDFVSGFTSKAVAVYCKLNQTYIINLQLAQLPGFDSANGYYLEDLWSDEAIGFVDLNFTYVATCNSIDAKMFKATLPQFISGSDRNDVKMPFAMIFGIVFMFML